MADPGNPAPPRSVVSVWPALAILAFALDILWWSQSYSPIARQFPSVVAGILAVLALIDLWSRLPVPGRGIVADFWGTSFERREMTHRPALRDEIALTLWVLAAFAGTAVFGILMALPAFCFAYVWRRARRPALQAAAAAVILFGFEFTVFEWLLNYELYRGLLFAKGGLSRW